MGSTDLHGTPWCSSCILIAAEDSGTIPWPSTSRGSWRVRVLETTTCRLSGRQCVRNNPQKRRRAYREFKAKTEEFKNVTKQKTAAKKCKTNSYKASTTLCYHIPKLLGDREWKESVREWVKTTAKKKKKLIKNKNALKKKKSCCSPSCSCT